MVSLRGVDGLFLAVYIAKHQLKPRDLNLSERSFIRNFDIIHQIKQSYRSFQTSGMSIEDFFNTQVVSFEASHENRSFLTNTVEVIRSPSMVFKINKGRNRSNYTIGVPFDKIKLNTPIKMSLNHIFAIHGITDDFDSDHLEGMFELEDRHHINIHLYLLNDNMRGYRNSRIPGTRAIYHKDIYIGMRDNQFYWIKKNLTTKRYYCAKPGMLGKCCYWSTNPDNTRRHEVECSDQTKIRADQVKSWILLN